MSHLAPQAAIFSPSAARAAASTAKDWAYVDAWLRRQFAALRQGQVQQGHGQDGSPATAPQNQSNISKPTTTSPPPFERNPETLEALLSLIAANEEADEDRDRLARLESAALSEVRAAEDDKDGRRRRLRRQQKQKKKKRQQQRHNTASSSDLGGDGSDDDNENDNDGDSNGDNDGHDDNNDNDNDDTKTATRSLPVHGDLLADDLLHALDESLTKEGQAALDALADVSLSLGTAADPSPPRLAARFVELQGRAHDTEILLRRVELLRSYVSAESARLSAFLEELRQAPQYRLVEDQDQNQDQGSKGSNAELERAVRAAAARLPELRRHVEALAGAVGVPPLTVEEVRGDEDAYLDLLARKKDLDAQVRAFAGLPPDVEAARVELESLRAQLREATETRDANFEMLVERESPVKVRTSRRF
ncbi:hypothetical protein F5Y14DRAFT_323654 [Nemania sp. NC0429]|nr:hypothetical protein F5Y14DRAFT_323654 [Nemania sp. NC0429]